MTPIDLDKLQQAITASFIRSNVLSIDEVQRHAGLAVDHVKNALALAQARRLTVIASSGECQQDAIRHAGQGV